MSSLSLAPARLCILLAALLWSTSGAFTKILRENTGLGLNEPAIDPLSIAFWRVVFAAAVFQPMVRRNEVTFRPALWLTGLVLQRTGHFYWAFVILVAVAFAGAGCWIFLVGPVQQVAWRANLRSLPLGS